MLSTRSVQAFGRDKGKSKEVFKDGSGNLINRSRRLPTSPIFFFEAKLADALEHLQSSLNSGRLPRRPGSSGANSGSVPPVPRQSTVLNQELD